MHNCRREARAATADTDSGTTLTSDGRRGLLQLTAVPLRSQTGCECCCSSRRYHSDLRRVRGLLQLTAVPLRSQTGGEGCCSSAGAGSRVERPGAGHPRPLYPRPGSSTAQDTTGRHRWRQCKKKRQVAVLRRTLNSGRGLPIVGGTFAALLTDTESVPFFCDLTMLSCELYLHARLGSARPPRSAARGRHVRAGHGRAPSAEADGRGAGAPAGPGAGRAEGAGARSCV